MSKGNKVELNKDKLLTQLANLRDIAKSNHWVLDYDKALDQFYYGLKKMPKHSFLFSIDDELNLYVTKNSDLNGLFIEYFSSNFIEHNKQLKPFLELVSKEKKKIDKEKAKLAKEAFQGDILKEFVTHTEDKLVTVV